MPPPKQASSSKIVVKDIKAREIPKEEVRASRILLQKIAETFADSLPSPQCDNLDIIKSFVAQICRGEMQAWAFENSIAEPVALAVTFMYADKELGRKTLSIFAMKAFKKLSQKAWKDGLRACYEYAIAHDCTDVEYITQQETLADMGVKFGFSKTYRCIKSLREINNG